MHPNARKILRRLAKEFKRKHYGMFNQLDHYQVSILELVDFSPKGMARGISDKPPLSDLIIDLVRQEYLKSPDSLRVSLTELGLSEGLRSNPRRIWDFINRSPGLAILISLASFILALASFIFVWLNAKPIG